MVERVMGVMLLLLIVGYFSFLARGHPRKSLYPMTCLLVALLCSVVVGIYIMHAPVVWEFVCVLLIVIGRNLSEVPEKRS